MRALIILFLLLPVLANAQKEPEELGGDAGLACQAILCLSSWQRPSECNKALRRYFSIRAKKPWKMISRRKSFLKLCPSSDDTTSANMPELVDNISKGAGRCNAAYLNKALSKTIKIQVCPPANRCYYKTITIIDNHLPAYCKAYHDSEYTDLQGVKYVGEPKKGGYWENVPAI